MWTCIFAVTTVISALNWAKWKITAASFAYYIEEKQYKQPSDAEIAECIRCVLKYLFKSK